MRKGVASRWFVAAHSATHARHISRTGKQAYTAFIIQCVLLFAYMTAPRNTGA